MEWFKFYGGSYLSDPKIYMLTACERSCWLTLLAFASVAEDAGRVKFLTETQLMIAAGVNPTKEEWKLTVGVLAKFESMGMVTQSNGDITVLNWSKRQNSYLSSAERQARFRAKQKSNAIVTQSNAEVTRLSSQSNARKKERKKDIVLQAKLSTKEFTIENDSGDKETSRSVGSPETKRVEDHFIGKCQKDIGVKVLPSVAGRALIKRALKRISEKDCIEKIDEWFTRSLSDEKLTSITRCFSDIEINKFLTGI